MAIFSTIIIGFLIGLVAKMLMPGKDPSGFVLTTIIGIVGSFIGSYVGQIMGLYAQGEAAGFVMSVIGALVLLFVYHLIANGRATA